MMLGTRTAAWEKSGGGGEWTNPYITDGLVAMWDGEWNAGQGVHGDELPIDIIGNNGRLFDIGLNGSRGSFSVSQKSIITSDYTALLLPESISGTEEYTITFVGKVIKGAPYAGVIGGDSEKIQIMHGYCIIGGALLSKSAVVTGDHSEWTLSFGKDVQTLYKNGIVIGTTDSWRALVSSDYYGIARYSLFLLRGIINATSTIVHDGEFESCLFYNRALTADEVAANYSINKARFNLP